jgi:hypothetical protein
VSDHREGHDYRELVARYNKWRDAYVRAEKIAPNEPDWENGRLFFRLGYPHPDWRAFIIDEQNGGYQVVSASTERSAVATEGWKATFSRLEDAGKFVIATIADYLRIECDAEPIAMKWRAEGLDPRVRKEELPDALAKYSLATAQDVYMIADARGIKPEHHVLPLSYDELNQVLADGLPHNVVRAL